MADKPMSRAELDQRVLEVLEAQAATIETLKARLLDPDGPKKLPNIDGRDEIAQAPLIAKAIEERLSRTHPAGHYTGGLIQGAGTWAPMSPEEALAKSREEKPLSGKDAENVERVAKNIRKVRSDMRNPGPGGAR